MENLVENGGNVSLAMRAAGYTEATINNPSNLTKSFGYQELLSSSGLTEAFILEALVEDINAKRGRRFQELSLASEILGIRKRGSLVAGQMVVELNYRERFLTQEQIARLDRILGHLD